jgi:hypothetical protein
MSASEEGAVSRRSALAGILTGALAIPSVASAFVEGAQGRGSEKKGAQGAKDFNWQLRQNQGITDVASSSMAGTRTSAFGKSIFQNEKNAVNLPRPGLTCTLPPTPLSPACAFLQQRAASMSGNTRSCPAEHTHEHVLSRGL